MNFLFSFCFLSFHTLPYQYQSYHYVKISIKIEKNERYLCCEAIPYTYHSVLNALPFFIISTMPPDPCSFPRPLQVYFWKKEIKSSRNFADLSSLKSKTLNKEKVTVSCRWAPLQCDCFRLQHYRTTYLAFWKKF